MHELSAATAILRAVLNAAEGKDATRISKVKVRIGELTLLNPEQLQFCFEIAAKGSLAEGAQLDIQPAESRLKCSKCGSEFEWGGMGDDPALHLVGPKLKCQCGSSDVTIVSGRELVVLSMTIEQPKTQAS